VTSVIERVRDPPLATRKRTIRTVKTAGISAHWAEVR
jgi:hypothetical protein